MTSSRNRPLTSLCIALVACLVSANTFADVEFKGTVEYQSVNAKGAHTTMNYSSNGPKVRITMSDMKMSGIFILDLKTSKMLMLMPSAKRYMETDASDNLAPKTIQTELAEMKKTPKSETILGHECQLWASTDKDGTTHQVWVAPHMGAFYFAMAGGMPGSAEPPALRKMRQMGLFPLRMVDAKNGKELSRMEATKIDLRAPDASLFAVPSDYQPVDRSNNPR